MPSRISKEYYQLAKTLAILNYPRKALPSNWIFSNVHERLCLQIYSKISTKGFAFKLDILKCPRKALPSNVFLRAGLAKASTKDFVHKLASLNYPRKVRLGGLLKEYDWLTKMVAIPKYPRKALPSNWIFSNVHERLCLQMYF